MLQLRAYQERSLEALRAYFRQALQHGAQKAFVLETGRPYRSVAQLPGLPYVCLRVPTGGGKTLMACHAVGIAASSLLQSDRTLCLWLVPSNAILEQTLAALRHRQHPYRQALDAAFSGQLEIYSLAEALSIQRGSLDGATCIIVSTLAALRIEETANRKVYEQSDALAHHFTGLPPLVDTALERVNGVLHPSLANVLRLRRPVIIMDEAHNARTPLSFDTLARFAPSCVIEFTATPETRHHPGQELFASNVLHHVSAKELKAEGMVKLPIRLRTHDDWKETVGGAIRTQRALEATAAEEQRQGGEHLRPVVLIQAQPHRQDRETLTVEVMKRSLSEDFQVPDEQIAIATGQTRELDGVELFDPACPIRFIITMQALKEGWDCSFAYVLCSVAETGSARSVEQILGRILRLPHAKPKRQAALNCAYAFVASQRFLEAAATLKDALVEHGFERFEAERAIVPSDEQPEFEPGTLFRPIAYPASAPPDFSSVDASLRPFIQYDAANQTLSYSGPATRANLEAVRYCLTRPEDRQAAERLIEQALPSRERDTSPLSVPALAVRLDGWLELFDESHISQEGWSLAGCDASLSEAEFSAAGSSGEAGEVYVSSEGRVEYRFTEELHEQLTWLSLESGWTVAALANWLDRHIAHPDVPQAQSSLYLHRLVSDAIERRGFTLEQLARQKFRLLHAAQRKIDTHRHAAADRGYQLWLSGSLQDRLVVSPERVFSLTEESYAPHQVWPQRYQFQKHAFALIGDLNPEDREEHDCAVFLDQLPQVKRWARNLSRGLDSLWLQTSTDKFYPDFVAELHDGRFLVVEYKGAHLWTSKDSEEKRAVGELWEQRSAGKCLFIMPEGADLEAIRVKIGGGIPRAR